VILATKAFERVTMCLNMGTETSSYILFAGLLVLFALSYRKQTKYITQRVEAGKDEHR
jgi:hypothetical protein